MSRRILILDDNDRDLRYPADPEHSAERVINTPGRAAGAS